MESFHVFVQLQSTINIVFITNSKSLFNWLLLICSNFQQCDVFSGFSVLIEHIFFNSIKVIVHGQNWSCIWIQPNVEYILESMPFSPISFTRIATHLRIEALYSVIRRQSIHKTQLHLLENSRSLFQRFELHKAGQESTIHYQPF